LLCKGRDEVIVGFIALLKGRPQFAANFGIPKNLTISLPKGGFGYFSMSGALN
jgi:hypothetical protein